MKNYLKMAGLVLFYFVLSTVIIFAFIIAFRQVPALASLFNIAPIFNFGFSDPVIILCYILFFIFIRKQSLFKYCKFTKISFPIILICAAFGLSIGLFTYSLVSLDYVKTNYQVLYSAIREYMVLGNIFALLILVSINSFYKEITFRGLMFNEMRDSNVSVTVAIIIQALLYGLLAGFGGSILLGTYAFIGAILFGLVYYLGKSIWASWVVQVCSTLGMVLIDRVIPHSVFNNTGSAILLVVSIIALAALYLVLYKNYKTQGSGKNNALAS